MTNREKLLKTCEFDLLCRMNENIKTYQFTRTALCCVLNGFRYEGECDKECDECIANWLNSEYDGRW